MNKLVIAAALSLGLAACNNASDDADTPSAEAPAATEAATSVGPVTANGSAPGNYEVTAADGTKSTSMLNADGTYTDSDAAGKVTASGTWSTADGKTCFDPEGDDGATCYTETAPAADGTFTATADEEVLTVKRVS